MSMVYLNGKLLPIEEACVPVLDRGFLLGDGVYEVIPAYAGKLFRLQQHLQRLDNSLQAIRIPNPYTREQWQTMLEELIKTNGDGDQSVYLQVTRGVAAKRDHAFPEQVTPTVFAMSNPMQAVADDILLAGVKAVTLEDIRWKRCDVKAITLLANVILRQQAHDQDAAEAILIRDGHALEGAASNLFIVRDHTLITPPKGQQLLPGITRDLVLELSQQHDFPCIERDIASDELEQADEIWLTSSTKEILPVTRLNEKPVSDGKPGSVWHSMISWYREYKQTLRDTGSVT